MKEMHEKGVTINDIVEVLKRTPVHSRIIPAIKHAYDAGYFVLSCTLGCNLISFRQSFSLPVYLFLAGIFYLVFEKTQMPEL